MTHEGVQFGVLLVLFGGVLSYQGVAGSLSEGAEIFGMLIAVTGALIGTGSFLGSLVFDVD